MFTTLLILTGIYFLTRNNKMIDPLTGVITSPFGWRASGFHNGTDIATNVGTPIKSPADGKVVAVFFDNTYGGGYSLVIEHDNGYRTGYAHLSGFHVQTGETVKQGQIVADSGNTGYSTGPHLHFTLSKKDPKTNQWTFIDPQTIFKFK